METELVPIRARAKELAANPSLVSDALAAGTARCRTIASATMKEVRDRMGIN
jgi:tryptophanyl-tRNA synthetase